jgi:phage/plasmid-associated DNA primase
MDTELCAGGGKSTISTEGVNVAREDKVSIKQQQYEGVTAKHRFINFRGATLVEADGVYTPLTSTIFARLFVKVFKFATISQIKEVEHLVRHDAEDYSDRDHLIAFGSKVWDAKNLEWTGFSREDAVFRSSLQPAPASRDKAFAYLLQLSKGDEALAWDMIQGLAPLFMHRKPAGVIWFVGGGANGKSALINAVYKIIGDHLTSLSVASIEDGRDVLVLNGVMGNICRESSETRVEDSEKYKAIGTHEPFPAHKFNSQEPVTIRTNFHTVFNANNIPIFSDKTEGARRRTLIVPFPAKFPDNPLFEEQTFTPAFLGGLLSLLLEATEIIRDNRIQYRFSDATLGAKQEYDSEVNSAEAFLAHLREHRVRAFTNYNTLRVCYENWCTDNGYVPLGITNLKKVMQHQAFVKPRPTSVRSEGKMNHWYMLDNTKTTTPLISLSNGMHVGLMAEEAVEDEVPVVEQAELGKDW